MSRSLITVPLFCYAVYLFIIGPAHAGEHAKSVTTALGVNPQDVLQGLAIGVIIGLFAALVALLMKAFD